LDVWVLGLDNKSIDEIIIGLNVWKKTLRGHLNIITDIEEKKALELLIDILDLEMKFTIPNKDNKAGDRAGFIPSALEKNKGRRTSRLAVKIDPGKKLLTNKCVGRIMFLLSVYFELNCASRD
jgi:hypothetical protein